MSRKILVVDDESSVRKMIVGILSSAGHEQVVEADDGIAACELMSDVLRVDAGIKRQHFRSRSQRRTMPSARTQYPLYTRF